MALPEGVKAVNIGCGITIAPGWINIDNSPNARLAKYPRLRRALWKLRVLSDSHYKVAWPDSILIHDARKELPFGPSSIDYVYTSHFLEHNSLDDARKIVSNVFRVLKPGGLLRVVVPDLALGARQYLDALRADPSDSKAARVFLDWMQLSRPGVRDPHLWMYDAASLSSMLAYGGFVNVTVCDFREGRVPDCDILDTRPEDSLHMEAEKP
ncbi:MAG TPA: methyltransferase domain-containing protein [Blastocatellia bacterium]|nr:methyltransferase domain-containing protein [Blastocatellia bacterium]